MNQITQVMTTLIHYKVAVRDTLEYTLNRPEFNIDAYKEKKRSILVEVDQKTPLKNIIDNSGENGQKLEALIREFYETVYGDSSTILKLADDGLRVDHAQHQVIFKYVLPIHENIEGMLIGLRNDAAKNNLDCKEATAVDLAEERLYRGVFYMTGVSHLVKLFGDYNQARREAKGEESAASRFIGNDINETVSYLSGVRANNHLTDERFNGVQDKVFMLIDFMTGRRELPMGKSFGDVIRETQDAIAGYVREVEPVFQQTYLPLVQELVKEAQANGGQLGGKPAEGDGEKA
ncbi:MAG: hypothetical protein K5694_00090 [Bacilli bacterium]|nr:hypothetical protein [Bacilli bacterium]